jgi:hypothetical protein
MHEKHPKLVYRFITFKFQDQAVVYYLIEYLNKTKLYSERTSYRAKKSKDFLEIKKYKEYPLYSTERQIYTDFLKN